MERTVAELATLVKGRTTGDGARRIRGVAGLAEATESDLSFLRDADKSDIRSLMEASHAGVILVPTGVAANGKTLIEVKNPIAAFATVLGLLADEKGSRPVGIHPLASIADDAIIGTGVSIGPFCVVERGAVIEDGATLVAQVFVGPRTRVGKKTLIYPQVVLREDVHVGEGCIIHGGVVIGSDGYGFYFDNGRHNKIPQVGNVVIEDDVEIGAGSAIDRATTGSTTIRRGTKIDNLVHVAHNVDVGPGCLLVGQSGIAGSSRLGAGVILAGQAGIGDHVNVGAGAKIGGQSGVQADVPAGAAVFGSPAQPFGDTVRQGLLVRRLPALFKDVKKLKESIENHDRS